MSMSFVSLNKQQETLREKAREVCTRVIAPAAAEVDRTGKFPREGLNALYEAGLAGIQIPRELGGAGVDPVGLLAICEEVGRACGSTGMCLVMHVSTYAACVPVMSPAQIDRFIAPAVSKRWIGTHAISEPATGSHFWAQESSARKQGDRYVVNSRKGFVTSAGHSDHYLILVRSAPDAPLHSTSAFMIDGKAAGVRPDGEWMGTGLRGNCSAPMLFQDVEVSEEARVGKDGEGVPTLFAPVISNFMVGIAGVYLGIADAALDAVAQHVKDRSHADAGAPLAKVDVIQGRIAEMKLKVDACRALVYNNAAFIGSHNPPDIFVPGFQMKVMATQTAVEVCNLAMLTGGGMGYKRDRPLERYLRDAHAGNIMSPTTDFLKLFMGRAELGLDMM